MNTIVNQAGDVAVPARDRSRAFGSILVEHGRLTPADAEEIQRYAGSHGMRFGEAALKLKLLTQQDIDFAVAQQFNYPILQRGGQGGVADASHKAVAITSPGRREGRSWLAANLAAVFAQIGERTLLIDADMRYPRQHELFNLSNAVGLSALLTGRAGKETACRIHPHLRLFVLPAGPLPPNPQELLGRPVFDLVLERFIDQFDVILIDTPAAAETADAQIVAKRAGAAIMLARQNVTRHAQLTAAMQSLTQTGVNVIGSVLNEY
jgi:protein-tyrosine kinase